MWTREGNSTTAHCCLPWRANPASSFRAVATLNSCLTLQLSPSPPTCTQPPHIAPRPRASRCRPHDPVHPNQGLRQHAGVTAGVRARRIGSGGGVASSGQALLQSPDRPVYPRVRPILAGGIVPARRRQRVRFLVDGVALVPVQEPRALLRVAPLPLARGGVCALQRLVLLHCHVSRAGGDALGGVRGVRQVGPRAARV